MKLPAIQTQSAAFSLVELDYSALLAHHSGLDLTIENNLALLAEINQDLITTLSAAASGIVLDPIYTLPLLKQKKQATGLVLRLEKQEVEPDPLVVPTLISNWSVESVKNNYAIAKLELYYHPEEEHALIKKRLAAELYDYCQYEKIAFLLKLIIYTPADEEFDQVKFQEAQLQTIRELRKSADLMALQFPYDALSCATLTAELDQPWLLNLEADDYETAKQNLRTSMENGAAGFLVRDVLLKELANLRKKDMSPDMPAIKNFIQTTARDRLLELGRIADELAEGAEKKNKS